jgi:ribosomal protein S18 acetylase RimI-like enzyme
MSQAISLRPLRPDDETFSYEVYASTRAEEMTLVPWEVAQKEAFVRMQFNAQRQYYRDNFPEASWQIIEGDGRPIGRLITRRAPEIMVLMDIALLPAYRNRGIGTSLIRDLIDEAARMARPLRLHVEFFNPARRLYERLGFKKIGEYGIYSEMEWRAERELEQHA